MKHTKKPATKQSVKLKRYCLNPHRSTVYKALAKLDHTDWDPSMLYGYKDLAIILNVPWKTVLFRLEKDRWPIAKTANLHNRFKRVATLVWGETLQELTQFAKDALAEIEGGAE